MQPLEQQEVEICFRPTVRTRTTQSTDYKENNLLRILIVQIYFSEKLRIKMFIQDSAYILVVLSLLEPVAVVELGGSR